MAGCSFGPDDFEARRPRVIGDSSERVPIVRQFQLLTKTLERHAIEWVAVREALA